MAYNKYNIKKMEEIFKDPLNKKLLNENKFDELFKNIQDQGYFSFNSYGMAEFPSELSQFLIDANIDFIPYLTEILFYMFCDVDFKNKPVVLGQITKLESYSFSNSNLTSITIPNSVEEIESDVFRNCSELTSVIISNGVVKIGAFAFQRCTGLTSITIPDSIIRIGDYAFAGCTELIDINFGKNSQLKRIGYHAFEGCINLTKISIPDSVTEIETGIFYNCPNLHHIEWRGKIYKSWEGFRRAFNKSK